MRNWHIKVIKLQEARTIIADVNGLNQFGNPNLYIGVIEGKMEYSAIVNTASKYEDLNYKSSNKHLSNEDGDRKVIYRERYDSVFYDENLQFGDANEMTTMTHTTPVAGIIAGKDVGDHVFGICPNSKIINSSNDFEVALVLSLIQEYTKGNIDSYYYDKSILIKNSLNGLIEGTDYLDTKKIPSIPESATNNLSDKKCSIINCSFSFSSYSNSRKDNMPKSVADFIFKELFAYGRDGRGVLVVFAAGNENSNIDNSDLCSVYSSKPLIVAASKVTILSNNMNLNDEDRASYSNKGERVDICAPSCPVGKSSPNEIEIYAPTAINCGEIGDNDQVLTATVIHKVSLSELILDNKYNVVFAGQSIEIGDPTGLTHEVRFITNVKTSQFPSNPDPTLNNRTKVTLDQPIVFTEGIITSCNVKICILKKNVSKFSDSKLTLENFKGIGKYQTPLQKAYLYSEDTANVNDFSVGMFVTLENKLSPGNVVDIQEVINLSRLTNLKLIPSQITATLESASKNFFKAKNNTSLQGFFSGQQIYINEESVKRHLVFDGGIGENTQIKFSQFSSKPDGEGDFPSNEYTIKSLAYGNVTSSFGGTSAASPIVSGVAALVLSANSNLNAAEIKHILKATTDKITGASHYSLDTNTSKYNYGYTTNDYFGTGRVNAEAAVQLALDWHDPTKYGSTVLKPKLEIADKLNGSFIESVPIAEPVNSPDIWVKPIIDTSSSLPTPTTPFNAINTSKDQNIYVRVRNTGNRNSFKESDLRVFVAFTDEATPAFPFPTMWYDQTDVKLLAVKEIPIIPFGGEAVIQVEWKDIAVNWNSSWNQLDPTTGKRKRTYILAHIAPFDGIEDDVKRDNIRNNKQLTCKEIIVTHIGLSDRKTYLPGNKLNITVGSEVITKSFDLTTENILTTEITGIKIKATKKNNNTGQTIEEIIYKKTGINWAFETAPSSNWIAFDSPTEIVGNHLDYTNIKIPHTINVSDAQIEVKLEIVNA